MLSTAPYVLRLTLEEQAHPVRHNPHALLSRRTEALSSGGAQSDKEADPEVQAANAEVGTSGNPRDTSLAAINSLMEPSF